MKRERGSFYQHGVVVVTSNGVVVVTSNSDGHGNEDVAIEISMCRLIFEIRNCEFFPCFVGGLVEG